MPDLSGKYSLDIGSGSGIHSLAAFKASAAKSSALISTPHRSRPPNACAINSALPTAGKYSVDRCSIRRFSPRSAGRHRLFLGVLPHRTHVGCRAKRGQAHAADRSTTSKSAYWLATKQRYNRWDNSVNGGWKPSTSPGIWCWPNLVHGRNPLRVLREVRGRGMDYMTDLRDWLGGLPYEDAKPEEVLQFGRTELGLELINLSTGEAYTVSIPAGPYRLTRP